VRTDATLKPLRRLRTVIDHGNESVGRLTGWLTLAMVVLGAVNALGRYLGAALGLTLSSNALIELQWYAFSAVFLLGAADALRADAHVRVDVLYGRLGSRARDAIDLAGTLIFLLPFCWVSIQMAWPAVMASIELREQSPDPGGLARYPVKMLIPLGIGLLALQGVSQALAALERLHESRAKGSDTGRSEDRGQG
jgi:TRAP-type mannitol/chloroaromatic compound transport system permease small subunit